MALTKDIITKNLPGLTDEQVSTVITLSQNDEENYMKARIREVYNEMDETISSVLGVQRDGAEKTYNYLERAAKAFAGKYADYDSLKGQVASLTKEKAALEKAVAEGVADKDLASKYETAQKELANTKKAYGALKDEFDRAKTEHEGALLSMRVDSALEAAAASVHLRKDVNPQLAQFGLRQALSTVKGFNPAFEDDGNGGKVLVFYNEDKTRMNNPEKALAPYTASDLIARELSALGLVEQTGAGLGTGGKAPQGAGGSLGARTRVEAHEIIEKQLATRGIVRGTQEWQDEFFRISSENGVDKLPLQ